MLVVICRQGGDGNDMVLGFVDTKEEFIDTCHKLGLKVEQAKDRIGQVLMEAAIPQTIGEAWLDLEEVPNFSQENMSIWFRELLEFSQDR